MFEDQKNQLLGEDYNFSETMAYDTSTLKAQAIADIEKNKLVFLEDIYAYLGISSSTFYQHFPRESQDYKELVALLDKNKIKLKVSLRSKWLKSDNASTQIALYKVISTDEEAHRLNGSKQQIEIDDKRTISIDDFAKNES